MNTLVRGILHQDIPLSNYTSWRVGGLAEKLYLPSDIESLAQFIRSIPQNEPIFFIGLGSNLLVRDGKLLGVTIVTQGNLNHFEIVEDNLVRAEAGVSCAQMARFCARNSLEGIEFLAGIPGTIGGALAMNAGCDGGETWEYVEKVETLDRKGQHHIRFPDEYQVNYRSVIPAKAEEWFVAGYFRLKKGTKDHALERIRHLLDRRAATQPTNEPSCGSVFRNPLGDYAARLIEECGLKGFAIGGAVVSDKHANFILNEGHATALDIERLISHIKQTVLEKCGVELIQEVHLIGSSV